MSKEKAKNLHVVETDWDELEQKIRAHRKKKLRRLIIVVAVAAAVLLSWLLVMRFKTYNAYTVREEIERSDTSATKYLAFGDGYLRYSNDGASYVLADYSSVWNQSYEMDDPMVAICQSYVAVADRSGETIYIMNKEGLQGEITVNMPISRISVASQGTVAVLMTENGTSYLSLYDKSGDQIAEGAIHVENSGTPVDIALSTDGKNLGVAILDVSSGTASTTINFYNFGTVGQNQIDNLVSSYNYADTIIADLVYVEGNTMLAFADNGVYTFSGANTPKEDNYLAIDEEIQSVFYDEDYFGLVFSDSGRELGKRIEVYDTNCRSKTVIETSFSYDSIGFLDNHEICLYNSSSCKIFTLSGLERFTASFEEDILGVFHERGFRRYLILKEGVTERIRFNWLKDYTTTESE